MYLYLRRHITSCKPQTSSQRESYVAKERILFCLYIVSDNKLLFCNWKLFYIDDPCVYVCNRAEMNIKLFINLAK